MNHFIYMSHICCSLWCNFYITKTWTGLPSFSGAPLCKKAQNNHTNKVCVSPALVTHVSGTMPCCCYPTPPKNPSGTAAGAGWKHENSHQDSLQELCRFGFTARLSRTARSGLDQADFSFWRCSILWTFSLKQENHQDLGFPSFTWHLIHLIAS